MKETSHDLLAMACRYKVPVAQTLSYHTYLLLFFLTGFSLGCSSSFNLASAPEGDSVSFEEFNAAARDKDASVVLGDDSTLRVHAVQIGASWTSWVDPGTNNRVLCPTSRVSKIVLKYRFDGAMQGALAGMEVGAGAGLLAGAALTDFLRGDTYFPRLAVFFGSAGIGAGAGVVAGAIAGVIIGHSHEYFLEHASVDPKSRFVK